MYIGEISSSCPHLSSLCEELRGPSDSCLCETVRMLRDTKIGYDTSLLRPEVFQAPVLFTQQLLQLRVLVRRILLTVPSPVVVECPAEKINDRQVRACLPHGRATRRFQSIECPP